MVYLITSGYSYYIGISGRPQQRLSEHNREKKAKKTCRYTKNGAPHWIYALSIGPLERGSHLIQKEWKRRVSEEERDAKLIGKEMIAELATAFQMEPCQIGWE